MRNRIMNYLASGIKPVQVASIVGVSPGYISQLLKEDAFKEELEAQILAKPAEAEEQDLDNKYISLEHQIIKNIEEAMPGSELPALSRLLEAVSKRQDMRMQRKHPIQTQNGNVIGVQIVQLQLPAHALPSEPVIELNSQKEILSINNKPLAPMSSDSVKAMFSQLSLKKEISKAIEGSAFTMLPAAVPADL